MTDMKRQHKGKAFKFLKYAQFSFVDHRQGNAGCDNFKTTVLRRLVCTLLK